jgi:prepilin-type processing-associated H-X9-DG protein
MPNVPDGMLATTGRRRRSNFIAVTTIILMCFMIIGYMYTRSSELANRTVCSEHLANLYSALMMYTQDYDGGYPPQNDHWPHAMLPYVGQLSAFFCPSDNSVRTRRGRKRADLTISYWYQPAPSEDGSTKIAIFGDRMYSNFIGNHEDGGNVAFMDGHVSWVTSASWEKRKLPTEKVFLRWKRR